MSDGRRIVIRNPRLPYVVIAERTPKKGDFFCIVKLTGRFYRLLHINSGLTASDVTSLRAAKEFVKSTRAMSNDEYFKKVMTETTWVKYCSCVKTKNEFDNCLMSLVSKIGHVPKSTTKNELYHYPPEYLI